ncbi:MAG: DbpA RNA binding domain-containing protein [Sphaerochaetaceae bacterium]|nr:DbpA RNA binding domain-containing protein [Sphaerochaetaceae bacterium]
MTQSEKSNREQNIKELVQDMKLYNNPELLEEMKKVLRKNVPFSMRGYLLAYLYVTSPKFNSQIVKSDVASHQSSYSHQIPDDAVSFYINVGKMSRGSARELAGFICREAGISDEDLLSVIFKQNYSFFNVRKNKADVIINNVNGKTFRGRKVKVNFSKDSSKDEN